MSSARTFTRLLTVLVLLAVMFGAGWLTGAAGIGSAVDPASLPELERQFVERMRGSVLVGKFTIAGREDREASPDRSEISSVDKVGDDQWRFNARMQYGNVDVTLPIVVTMRWADDTPIITMTDVTIPTLGTFTARVFFYGDRYAGTWQHDKVGGHMYGRIERSKQT
jgi:hypothetical protein